MSGNAQKMRGLTGKNREPTTGSKFGQPTILTAFACAADFADNANLNTMHNASAAALTSSALPPSLTDLASALVAARRSGGSADEGVWRDMALTPADAYQVQEVVLAELAWGQFAVGLNGAAPQCASWRR